MTFPNSSPSHANDVTDPDDVIESHSWRTIGDRVAIKELDRSAFFYNETGVPGKIQSFFGIDSLGKGASIEIGLIHNDIRYQGTLLRKNDDTPHGRTQLHWRSDFSAVLKAELPEWYDYFNSHEDKPEFGPELRLSRMEDETGYYVSIVDVAAIRSDIESELIENQNFQPLKEGRIKEYYGKRYERSAANRKRAIEIHGYECAVCGFDFFKVYGERGKEFIEVHHIKPISTSQEEIVVNPETDLVTVCANCHRMIHRYPDDILSTDELRERMTLNVIQ